MILDTCAKCVRCQSYVLPVYGSHLVSVRELGPLTRLATFPLDATDDRLYVIVTLLGQSVDIVNDYNFSHL